MRRLPLAHNDKANSWSKGRNNYDMDMNAIFLWKGRNTARAVSQKT
jgi:hypothetical protein